MTLAVVDPTRPMEKGLVESIEVNLVIMDVQVLDRKGNAVPDLVASDFDIFVNNVSVPIVSVDASCSELLEKPDIVLAFDYQHLSYLQRGDALESARRALERARAPDMEVMVVALTGGLRVEQPFTTERDRISTALRGMRNDATLFGRTFEHTNETGFVRGLSSLFDVVATVPRPKAILLYSSMKELPLDSEFRDLAAMAAASRSVIYPIDVRGLGGVGATWGRLSTESAVNSGVT